MHLRRPPCPYFSAEVHETRSAIAWCGGSAVPEPSLRQLCSQVGRSVQSPPPAWSVEGHRLPSNTAVSPPPGDTADEYFTRMLSSGADAAAPSATKLEEWFLLPSRDRELDDRPTLVLDLDETLIHSVEASATAEELAAFAEHGGTEPLTFPGNGGAFRLVWRDGGCLYVHRRPGLRKFLDHVKDKFEVVLWTAGMRGYARAVLSVIDEGRRVFGERVVARDRRWFKPQPDGEGYAKVLNRLGRSLHRTILLDNSPGVCRLSADNCVVVPDYFGPQPPYSHPDSDSVLEAAAGLLDEWLHARMPAPSFLRSADRINTRVPDHSDYTPLHHLQPKEKKGRPARAPRERAASRM
eukprot:TRINITY_DN2468_c2_g1_i1.p1 TRINITY_DN2468_c2_g1~~TRINITY_DN2468_c2_g1_i1.p1  ORF type:complete len:352 (+),score=122.39 TRINITY_DN2468_c2_g1_i1:87-1142(+)